MKESEISELKRELKEAEEINNRYLTLYPGGYHEINTFYQYSIVLACILGLKEKQNECL